MCSLGIVLVAFQSQTPKIAAFVNNMSAYLNPFNSARLQGQLFTIQTDAANNAAFVCLPPDSAEAKR